MEAVPSCAEAALPFMEAVLQIMRAVSPATGSSKVDGLEARLLFMEARLTFASALLQGECPSNLVSPRFSRAIGRKNFFLHNCTEIVFLLHVISRKATAGKPGPDAAYGATHQLCDARY
eukprot:2549038-Rhodomonas_salina.1